MWDSRYFDWGEEVFSEVSTFLVSPCKRTVLLAHEMMDEFAFFQKEESASVYLVELLPAFLGIVACRREFGWPHL